MIRIKIKRAYDPPVRADGRRVLVERLWPRGIRKADLAADAWLKDVAPSTRLRKWFDHREERWIEFGRRYRRELNANPEAWKPILAASRRGTVTLLYAAHDTLHNGAVVLHDYLAERDTGRAHRKRRKGHWLKEAPRTRNPSHRSPRSKTSSVRKVRMP